MKRLTTEQVIMRFHEKHGNRYDYSKVRYINRRTQIKIICPHHGEFEQTSDKHFKYGCWDCGIELRASNKKLSTTECIDKCIAMHGNRYDYSKVNYVDSKTKITITCREHGDFSQIPTNHYHGGHNCPICANIEKCGGYDSLSDDELRAISPAYVYHIGVEGNGESFEKIGITIKPKQRFKHIGHGYKVVWSKYKQCDNMLDAFLLEQQLHNKYNEHQYIPNNKIGGYTECFKPNLIGQ